MTEPGLHFIWHSEIIRTTTKYFFWKLSFDTKKII